MKYSNANTNFSNHSERISFSKLIARLIAMSSTTLKKFLFEERRLLKRKRIANEMIPPAPFYDELHFANYE